MPSIEFCEYNYVIFRLVVGIQFGQWNITDEIALTIAVLSDFNHIALNWQIRKSRLI